MTNTNKNADTQAGESESERDTDIVGVPRWALREIEVYMVEGHELDYSYSDDEIVQAMTEVYRATHGVDYLCELCSYPSTGSYRLGDGDTIVCSVHADALESGQWDGETHDVEPIGEGEGRP